MALTWLLQAHMYPHTGICWACSRPSILQWNADSITLFSNDSFSSIISVYWMLLFFLPSWIYCHTQETSSKWCRTNVSTCTSYLYHLLIQPSSSPDFYTSLPIGFVPVLIYLQVSSSPHWSHIDPHKVWIKYTVLKFSASKSRLIPRSTNYGFF